MEGVFNGCHVVGGVRKENFMLYKSWKKLIVSAGEK